MTQSRWPDGGDRHTPPGSQRVDPGPDPGAGDRGRAVDRDAQGPHWKDRGAYGDDRSVRHQPSWSPPPATRRLRRWGTLPGRTGVFIVVAAAALGALITAVTGSQPGLVLGVLVAVGTITAALAVRPRAAYLVIPVPALAYVVAATLAGLVSDRATGISGTALAINGAQWIASGFIAMIVATGLAIVITLVRWYASRRGQHDPRRSGQGPEDLRHDQRHPRHRPGAAGEGPQQPQAPRSHPAQRHT